MKSYIDTRRILDSLKLYPGLEETWFNTLAGAFSGSPPPRLPALANGEAQFFSIENFNPNRSPGANIPSCDEEAEDPDKKVERLLIVAVGINYGQSPTTTPPSSLVPHVYTRSGHASWVVDNGWPATRNALDAALCQFAGNAPTWRNNGYASPPVNPAKLCSGGQPLPYILVCTNVSLFLSQMTWGRHSPTRQQQALAVWDPNRHLCELIAVLGKDVDLWVVHGKQFVWPTFDTTGCIKDWLMTPNLSAFGRRWMRTFWKTQCNATPSAPIWPRCGATKANLLEQTGFDE
jgi:hypothetical protein